MKEYYETEVHILQGQIVELLSKIEILEGDRDRLKKSLILSTVSYRELLKVVEILVKEDVDIPE